MTAETKTKTFYVICERETGHYDDENGVFQNMKDAINEYNAGDYDSKKYTVEEKSKADQFNLGWCMAAVCDDPELSNDDIPLNAENEDDINKLREEIDDNAKDIRSQEDCLRRL